MEPLHISRLALEILLFIFLSLDSDELLICRKVDKRFRHVIDSNQILWRIFEWIQRDRKSFKPALDLFDEYSHHSLEKVSIQEQNSNEEDLLHLMQVLQGTKSTLREVTLMVSRPSMIGKEAMSLVTEGSRLRKLVIWNWASGTIRDNLPLSRLVPLRSETNSSSIGEIQLLWLSSPGIVKLGSKYLKSLKSFAQRGVLNPLECRELISNFSETIVHLCIGIGSGTSIPERLSCPNLKVFEGWVLSDGLTSFFDAPKLQTLVLRQVYGSDFRGMPSSVEEIWLRSIAMVLAVEDWELLLLHSCPKLKILKFYQIPGPDLKCLIKVLETRNQMAQTEIGIEGIKMTPLQKLILPTGSLSQVEFDAAAKAVGEIIDIKDYPNFIEVEC